MKKTFEIVIRYCKNNPVKTIITEDICVELILKNIKSINGYSLINALVQYCPKTKKDFIYVTGHHQGKYRFNAFRIDYNEEFIATNTETDYVNHIERLDNYPKITPIANPEILLIGPSPDHHPSEVNSIIQAYNDCVASGKTFVVMFGNGQATSSVLLAKLPKALADIVIPATGDLIAKYLQGTNLVGVFFNGDGETTGLSCAEGTTFEFSDLATGGFYGNLSSVVFVSASCIAFNYPFGSTMVEGYKIKAFISGLTELTDSTGPEGQEQGYPVGMYGAAMLKSIVYDNTPVHEAFIKCRQDANVHGVLDGDKVFNYGIWAAAGLGVIDIFPKGKVKVNTFSTANTGKTANGNIIYANSESVLLESEDLSQFKYLALVDRMAYPLVTFSIGVVIPIVKLPKDAIIETTCDNYYDLNQTAIACNEYTGLLPDKDVSFINSLNYRRYMSARKPGTCLSEIIYDPSWWLLYNEQKFNN